MATTTNFTVTKDARIARRESDNYDSGAGAGDGLSYGLYSGYRNRVLLGFNVNMAGWTSIVSAILHFKSSDQITIAFGSDPTFVAQRITTAWSEGSSSGLSSGNASIYPGPSATASNQVQKDAPTTENTWSEVTVTNILRDAMTVGAFYGIRLIGTDNSSVESDSAANVGEIYSRESGSGSAYLTITYETNRAPDAPTLSSPDVANGGLVGTPTPTINAYCTDPDANNIAQLHWQIDDNSDFSSPIQDVTAAGPWANGTTIPIAPAALTRGGTYYVRAQAADASVWGAWSGTFSFKVASLPTLTVTEPSASGRLARITYSAGSGWVSPRMLVNWGMTCPDGGSQATWRLEVYGDSGGAPSGLIEDITVNDTQSSRVVPYNLTEGNYYNVRITATCSHGLSSTVGFIRVRARWGVVTHRFDMGAATGTLSVTVLDVTDETNGGQGRVAVEYMTTTGAAPGSWAGTVGGAGLNRYFYYRTWLLIWGTSPAVSPTLNRLVIAYTSTSSVIVPDKWVFEDPANAGGDVASYVYGTKSLRLKGKGAGSFHWASQQIAVVPDTFYMLSGRVQSLGDTGAYIDLANAHAGTGVIQTPQAHATIDFEDPDSRVFPMDAGGKPQPWFSGSNTSVWVRCIMFGAVGTTAWFDAIKVEASAVVTPWSPGYVANAVVLDAGGLQIDGSNGGIFRLRGNSGGIRDLVELGGNGLLFGGDVPLLSPSPRVLQVGDDNSTGEWALNISGSAGGGEGGQLGLQGAGAYTDWNIDNLSGELRVHGAGTAPLYVRTTDPQVTVNSNLSINGEMRLSNDTVLQRWFAGSFLMPGHLLLQGILVNTGQLERTGGTSFPGGASVGDRFWRTDRGMEFYWDGSRWLSTALYSVTSVNTNLSVATSQWIPHPAALHPGLNIWLHDIAIDAYVSAGTALSASHKWSGAFNAMNEASGLTYTFVTCNIDSGASNVFKHWAAALSIATAYNASSSPALDVVWSKTGTPGNLTPLLTLRYRYIG